MKASSAWIAKVFAKSRAYVSKIVLERVYHDTPFYRKKMQEMGITPDDINSIDDIVKLPFTTKHDLRDNYPFGLCAVPMSQLYVFMLLPAQPENRLL